MLTNINKCVNAGQTQMTFTLLKHGIDVKRRGVKQIMELKEGEEVYERFKVIQFGEQRIHNESRTFKILKLKRVRNNALHQQL